jgi:hypothetical protein
MKKRLNTDQVQSELRGVSAFFPGYKGSGNAPDQTPEVSKPAITPEDTVTPRPTDTTTPLNINQTKQESPTPQAASKIESKPDRLLASNHASMLAISPEMIEAIRKVVKNPGKEEVLYVRVSKDEKDTLDDINYTYKRQGMKTSDNEIARVAINTLLADYTVNGANSLLAILLASLHD